MPPSLFARAVGGTRVLLRSALERVASLPLAAETRAPGSGLDRAVYREPSFRTFVTWTPDLIRSAELMAMGGNLRLAADLCEQIRADDRVQSTLSTRSKGLLGLPRSFLPGRDRRRSSVVVRALDQTDFARAFTESSLEDLLSWGQILGVGLGENIWETDDETGREIPRLKVWHPRWLRFDWPSHQWRLKVNDGATEITITPGDGKWLLYAPSGAERPWSRGAWRGVSRWWLIKHYAIQDFARHSEVHGSPLRVVIAAEKSQKDDRAKIAEDLRTLGRDTGMALPHGYDLKLVEATAKTWEMFKAQVGLADDGNTIAIAGQNLTTSVEGGSLAAAKVHQVIRNDLIRADNQSLSTALHDQVLVFWADYNFGDRSLAPWPQHDTTPPEDLAAVATTTKAAAEGLSLWQAEAAKVGKAVDVDAYAQRFGVALIEAPTPGSERRRHRHLRTAGTEPAATVIEGQRYVDDVLADSLDAAVDVLRDGTLGALLEALDAAESFDALSRALPHLLRAGDGGAFEDLVHGAVLCALACGTYTVHAEQAADDSKDDQRAPADGNSPPAVPIAATTDPSEFHEAVDWFRRKTPVTRAVWDGLDDAARQRAFTVAGTTDLEILADAQWAIDAAVSTGTTLRDFKRAVGPRLEAEWGHRDSARLETIFRNNVQSAYGAGRYQQITSPAVRSLRPYLQFMAIEDTRTTDLCKSLDTTVRPVEDWDGRIPPLHHQCRSSLVSLSERQADRIGGVTEWPDDIPASEEGWGGKPDIAGWRPDTSNAPAPLRDAFNARMENRP